MHGPQNIKQKRVYFPLGHLLAFQALKFSQVSLGFDLFVGLRKL
jgi:hypothetical protein